MSTLATVIIPTYNRAHLITDAINSVLNQTYENFELLVVDDHSTDNTKGVVEQYEDERVKYLVNKRTKGAQGARNTGLYAAKGEWVAMLDSDDVWLPNKLEVQIDCIKNEDSSIVGLGCGSAEYDFEELKIIKENIPVKETYTTNDLLYKNYLGGFSVFIFNREAALQVNGFDERFPAMQDMDLYIALSETGQVKSLNRVLVYLRTINKDRITNNLDKKYTAAKLLAKKYEYLTNEDPKLKNRAFSRIYMYGLITGRFKALKFSGWYFKGIFIDPMNQIIVSKYIVKEIIKKFIK